MSLTWGELEHMQPSRWRLPLPPTCGRCGYNLTGLVSARCPECGQTVDWNEVHRRAFRTCYVIRRLKHAHRDTSMGIVFGLWGWVLLGFGKMSTTVWFLALVYMGSFIMGLLALVLGAHVLNMWRVPKWARVYIEQPAPDIRLGMLAFLLGLSLVLGSCLIP